MAPRHERETALAVAAVTGVLERCWATPPHPALSPRSAGGEGAPLERGGEPLDWQWLLGRLDTFGLGALMFAESDRAQLLERFPAHVQDRLRRRAEQTAAQNAQLLAAAMRAGALLDAAGIPWMPMKGVALALVVPDHFAARPTSDFDVLVRPGDLARAARALGGELERAEVRDHLGEVIPPETLVGRGDQHAYSFRTRDGVVVELHHRFPVLTAEETSAVWDRAVPRTHRSRSVVVPALADLLGTACVHALVLHHGEPSVALRHLADAGVLLAAGADADRTRGVYDAAGRDSVARSGHALAEAREWVRVRGAPSCAAARWFDPDAGDRVATAAQGMAALAGRAVARLRSGGLRSVFPSRAFLENMLGEPAGRRSLAALQLRRWRHLLRNAVKGR